MSPCDIYSNSATRSACVRSTRLSKALLAGLATILLILSYESVDAFTAGRTPPWVLSPSNAARPPMNGRPSFSSKSKPFDTNASTTESSAPRASESEEQQKDEDTAENEDEFPSGDSTVEAAAEFTGADAHAMSSKKINGLAPNVSNHINGSPIPTPPQTVPIPRSMNMLIRPYLRRLVAMGRPLNLPGIYLFIVLGIHLTLQPTSLQSFLSTLAAPSMILTTLSVFLVGSTSCIVNDYYDIRTGTDIVNRKNRLPPPLVIKRFLTYLYTALLLSIAFLPGSATRFTVILSTLLTFWYTQHLKPRTWIKNLTCASIIALTPLTAGLAGLHVCHQPILIQAKLVRLMSTIFCAIMSREILMDVGDVEGDKSAGILTIPVKHGVRMASRVSFGFLGLVGFSILCGGLGPMNGMAKKMKLIAGLVGAGRMVQKCWDVVKTEGMDKDVVLSAVEDGKLSMLLILASFA